MCDARSAGSSRRREPTEDHRPSDEPYSKGSGSRPPATGARLNALSGGPCCPHHDVVSNILCRLVWTCDAHAWPPQRAPASRSCVEPSVDEEDCEQDK
jgi:hypothetical protein